MENRKNRKLNRLKGYDYSQDGWYFITICAKNKEHFFGKIINTKMELSETGKIAQKCWKEIPAHFPDIKLDEFIVMPNHIHGIIIIENNPAENKDFYFGNGNKVVGNNNHYSLQWQTKWARSLSSIVRGFKIGATKWRRENVENIDCRSVQIWQKSYYDHIIRNEDSLNKIRGYIINNPLKWEFDRNNAENLWM